MNYVRGDTVPMHHLFTLDEGAVVEAAYMRVLHEDGDDAGARKLLSVRDSLYISAVCPVPREAMDALAKAVG